MHIHIIGAGIGGLTTSLALQQNGIKTTIYEQAKAIKSVGAGIILANNAMQVYQKLGLKKEIEKLGNPIHAFQIVDANLKTISAVDLTYFEQKNGVQNIAIHRAKLQALLVDKVGLENIRLGKQLKTIDLNENPTLTFDDSSTEKVSTVIGADGIHSNVRKNVFPTIKIRKARQICWRGLTDFELPKKYISELTEAWGRGDRFGFVQIAPQKVYWYALKSYANDPTEFPDNNILNYFSNYNPLVKEIIQSTKLSDIFKNEITDLKPTKTWYTKNICLIGDAIHAATPNMGQGACQAIEDAYVLATCLSKYPIEEAFSQFQKLRLSKAHMVVNASWSLGKVAHLQNDYLIKLRNGLMKMTPESMSRRQSAMIFKLNEVG